MYQHLDNQIVRELHEIMGDDIGMLYETFLSDSENKLVELKDAIELSDGDLIRRTAHSLKGSSRNIGAVDLAANAESLEKAGREGNFDQLDAMFHAIGDTFSLVKSEIQSQILS